MIPRQQARRQILTKQGVLFPRISKKPETLQTTYLAAQASSEWFRSLPPKVQQQHFSAEERAHLGNWRTTVILDAADEALYKLGCQADVSRDSISSIPTVTSSSSTLTSHSLDSAIAMNDSVRDSFRWLEDDDSLDLGLDYHSHIAPTPSVQPQGYRRSSFRRTFSLTAQKGRPSTAGMLPQSSQPHTVPPSPLIVPTKQHRRSISRPQPPPRHTSQSSVASMDHPAQYYQDPEARLKLRVYLASPQKFDEAIEFGFPSLELKEGFNSRISIDHEWKVHDDCRTFLDNDSKSCLGMPLNDTNRSAPESHYPTSDNALSSASTVVNGSHDSRSSKHSTKPRLIAVPHNSPQNIIGNREMTLKMTLTRADLREPSLISSPPVSENDDPLRLADLPAPDEDLHIWDKPSEDRGVMKRFLRKLRKRR